MKHAFLTAFAALALVVCSSPCAFGDQVTIGLCTYGGLCNPNDTVAVMTLQTVTDANGLGGISLFLGSGGYSISGFYFNVRDAQGDTIPLSDAFYDVQRRFPCSCLSTDAETPFGTFDYLVSTGQSEVLGPFYIYAANLQTNLTLADLLVPTRNGTKNGGTFVATYKIVYGFVGGSIPVTSSPTPEPSALFFVGTGLLALGCAVPRVRPPARNGTSIDCKL